MISLRRRICGAVLAIIAVAACSGTADPTPLPSRAEATPSAGRPSRTPPRMTPQSTPAATATPTPTPAPTLAPTPTPSAPPGQLRGVLEFGAPARLIPADGLATATLVASVVDASGEAAAGERVELRALGDPGASIGNAEAALDDQGRTTFTVAHVDPGAQTFGLYGAWDGAPDQPLDTIEVEFTRKVVVLAPGFFSALASRFEIFGLPSECEHAASPRSIREALICLGYTSDPEGSAAEVGAATIVDMAWEVAGCRPADEAADPPRRDCVATIVPTPDGDVAWRPADYDLGDLTLSIVRQQQIDLWAHRLAETMVTYDEELHARSGERASFYLVGHSMGGQVVVRVLRALLEDAELAARFEGDGHGLLQRIIAIDGALNWSGTVDFVDQTECGMPAVTVADERRERDNVDAVERGHDRFGVLTVAMTSATDPIVGPDVALLREPVAPSRGYSDAVYHGGEPGGAPGEGACTHSTLLWPEPTGYPLNDVFIEHIGPAARP